MTNCSIRALISSSKLSTARQNQRTMLLSHVQCLRRVCFFQSSRSILPRPPIISYRRNNITHQLPRLSRCVYSTNNKTSKIPPPDKVFNNGSLFNKENRKMGKFCRSSSQFFQNELFARNYSGSPSQILCYLNTRGSVVRL